VRALAPYAANIPCRSMPMYVSAITQTYVGHIGGSAQFSRHRFYANGAARDSKMVEAFDDTASGPSPKRVMANANDHTISCR